VSILGPPSREAASSSRPRPRPASGGETSGGASGSSGSTPGTDFMKPFRPKFKAKY
jgi:hypothetical protein